MLQGSETWALTKADLQILQRNDRAKKYDHKQEEGVEAASKMSWSQLLKNDCSSWDFHNQIPKIGRPGEKM